MGALEGIEHVVVLMLENRSFDCILGKLYKSDVTFEGLSGLETNNYTAGPVRVWSDTGMDPLTATIPDPDPGELFADMNMQLFGGTGQPTTDPPSMSGFVQNYMAQPPADEPFDPTAVMHYFTPEQVPVISTLAKAFGVCDQWYASAPCQTWPNRFFVHTGTAAGYVENSKFPIPFDAPSIFHRLETHARTWRIYFHDVPQSILLKDIWSIAPLHFRIFSQFLVDAQNGALPNYSFIEPRYFTDLFISAIPNDEHPPHNVAYGEQLIASVYNAVRSSPNWQKTLLVITYDEHGGCFDHMPPPLAARPDMANQDGFNFDRYGVRVPAVLISPYIPPGSKVRAVPGPLPHQGPPYPFDHTSIIATLRKLFNLGAPLGGRDAVAPDLLGALGLAEPINDGPSNVTAIDVRPPAPQLQRRAGASLNHMQRSSQSNGGAAPVEPCDRGCYAGVGSDDVSRF